MNSPALDRSSRSSQIFDPTAEPPRVLLIEDDPLLRETLEESFAVRRYEVASGENGAAGMDLLGREDFDLILTDIQMPGVDGMALIEWAKETHPDTPLIVMTGHATVDSTVQALRLGAYDYLVKPFTLEEVGRTIENCLEKQRLQRRNDELARTNERLQEIERIKDDLLATVSHEFRTPLTALQGFLSLVEQQGSENLTGSQVHAFEAIQENVDQLQTMVENLLTLVETQDAKCSQILEPTSIAEFLDEYTEFLRSSKKWPSFEIAVDDDVRSTTVLLDRTRFPVALTNLLDNAFKFAKESGPVRVELRAHRDRDHAHLDVHDNGIGIPPSLEDRVFDRFTQADMTATRAYRGTGLGLAVVREIVRLHHGTVRLIPSLHGGASVRISLRAAPDGA